jgi:zinc/manganese transport system substrate-binding protein
MNKIIKFLSLIFWLTALLGLCALIYPTAVLAKQLSVVTTTTDLAALTREVGGDKVNVVFIAKDYRKLLHSIHVEDEAGVIQQLRQADLLIVVGRFLEIWLPYVLAAESGNPAIQEGQAGYMDASQFADILDVPAPTDNLGGNPYYWLDPSNGRRIAKGIANKLGEMDPADASYFLERFQDFDKRLSAREQKWDAEMQPYRGRKVVSFNHSFTYFTKHFGLDVVGYIENTSGTSDEYKDLIKTMKRERCKVVLAEPDFDLLMPSEIGRATGAQMLAYLPSVGGEEQVTNYFDLFEYDINLLIKAFKGVAVHAASTKKDRTKTVIVSVQDASFGDPTVPSDPCQPGMICVNINPPPCYGTYPQATCDPVSPTYILALVDGRPYALLCYAGQSWREVCGVLAANSAYTGSIHGHGAITIRGKLKKVGGVLFELFPQYRNGVDVTARFKMVPSDCFYRSSTFSRFCF